MCTVAISRIGAMLTRNVTVLLTALHHVCSHAAEACWLLHSTSMSAAMWHYIEYYEHVAYGFAHSSISDVALSVLRLLTASG
jgi:hypothetical protein